MSEITLSINQDTSISPVGAIRGLLANREIALLGSIAIGLLISGAALGKSSPPLVEAA